MKRDELERQTIDRPQSSTQLSHMIRTIENERTAYVTQASQEADGMLEKQLYFGEFCPKQPKSPAPFQKAVVTEKVLDDWIAQLYGYTLE